MGGIYSNEPMEVAGAVCSKCGEDLPQIRGWRDIKIKKIYGKWTHEFLGGMYYREKIPTAKHVCKTCFWTPEHILKKREQEAAERARAKAEEDKAETMRLQAKAEAAKAEALKATAELMKAKSLSDINTKENVNESLIRHDKHIIDIE
ncbi:uncharacterized protein [Ptychodera flava]|uniref:uncharacterized protein n=1 Tax=Ptychodera flava TaxID=63121 RepID=UPI00396A5ADA